MPNVFPITLSAVEGKINVGDDRIKIYTAELPAEAVAEFFVEAAINVQGGFQRPMDSNRAAKIGRLMGGDKARKLDPVPNVHGGLLAYAPDPKRVKFDRESGELTLTHPLPLIDGQHRAGGAKFAVANGKTADYTETVRVIVGATKAELAMWYLRCNLEARKVAPANILLNVAMMQGVVLRKKSWVARATVAVAAQEPFVTESGQKLVSWSARDGGKIGAGTLYRAVDLLLPPELNKEGPEVEEEAAKHAWAALDLYSRIIPNWGTVDEDGKFIDLPGYTFTMMAAFARVYAAIWDKDKKEEEVEETVRSAFEDADVGESLPETFGAGEKAATQLAMYIAGKADISLSKLAA